MPAGLKTVLYVLAGCAATILVTATSALAGSGVGGVFNLGQANTVNAESSLTGNTSGGAQLRVENSATTQNAFGVLGRITAGSPGTLSAGIRGINSGTNGNGFGVWGFHQSGGIGVLGETPTGTGVQGKHTGTSGTTPGVDGQSASTDQNAVGILGELTAASPGVSSAGVKGTNASTRGSGVFGQSTGGVGVTGCSAPTGAQFPCTAGNFTLKSEGGQFLANASDGIGIYTCAAANSCGGLSGPAIGGELNARGTNAIGLFAGAGQSAAGDSHEIGVEGSAAGDAAIGGDFLTNGEGSIGLKASGGGGGVKTGTGIIGTTAATDPGQIGVSGSATGTDGIGVKGEADTGANAVGVLGSSTSGLAGRFDGNVHVTGTITRAYTSGTSQEATPIAYAFIGPGGSVSATASTPNVSCSFNSTSKIYTITIAGENYNLNNYVTVVTPTSGNVPLIPTTQSISGPGRLIVQFFGLDGKTASTGFGVVVYKP